MNFPSQISFNDINHSYRAAILKKSSLWLLMSYMAVATYYYCEKVRRTMRTAIVSYLLKRVINWNKYLSKPDLLRRNINLNHLVEPSFQGINRLIVLAFENYTQRASHSGYYRPNLEIKDYNIIIDGKNFFDQPIKNNKVTYENIRRISTGQGDDYTTGCLLDHLYFKVSYKMIAADLSKQ